MDFKYSNRLLWVGLAIAAILVVAWATGVFGTWKANADSEPNVAICHKTESEQNPWEAILVDQSSVDTHLGHGDFFYQGTLKENGQPEDDGWCDENAPEEEVTPTPSEEPTPTDEVTPTPEVTATPSATPSETPSTSNTGGGGDGRSDGRSSCPECTQAPKTIVPAGPPATGRG